MKQEKIYQAYSIIAFLRNSNHTPEAAYKLFKLNRLLKPIYEFQLEQRRDLFKSIKPKKVEGGEITFETPEERKDADIEIKPVHIALSKLNQEAKLYPDDFEILEGIIEFDEDEEPETPEVQLELVPEE